MKKYFTRFTFLFFFLNAIIFTDTYASGAPQCSQAPTNSSEAVQCATHLMHVNYGTLYQYIVTKHSGNTSNCTKAGEIFPNNQNDFSDIIGNLTVSNCLAPTKTQDTWACFGTTTSTKKMCAQGSVTTKVRIIFGATHPRLVSLAPAP